MLCSKERTKRLNQRENIKQLKLKLQRATASYGLNFTTLEERMQQNFNFACLISKLWICGLTYVQIASIYKTDSRRISVLMFSHFPALFNPEVKAEQKLRTKQNWFECYDLLVNYKVSYEELEIFLSTATNLVVTSREIKREILAIKKLLEEGAKFNQATGFYTFLKVD